MNLVLIGASKLSLRCLSACLEVPGLKVVGVVTAPQTFPISYRPEGVSNVLYADVASFAADLGLRSQVLVRSMGDPGLFDAVAAWEPDAFLVVGWYHLIPRRWRELAPAFGLHASLLPDYSGGAPLVWAMINGEKKTGITLFQLDDGVDSGPIAGQKEEIIKPDDTIATLYARIEERGLELLRDSLPQIVAGSLKLLNQDEKHRRVVPQRSPENGRIDWTLDASYIDRFIRAQTKPYPGAFTTMDGEPLTIWRARVAVTSERTNFGYVTKLSNGNYTVGCKDGAVAICEISYKKKSYAKSRICEVLGRGGQILGA